MSDLDRFELVKFLITKYEITGRLEDEDKTIEELEKEYNSLKAKLEAEHEKAEKWDKISVDMGIKLNQYWNLEQQIKQLKEDNQVVIQALSQDRDRLKQKLESQQAVIDEIEEFLDSHTAENDPIRPLYKSILSELEKRND